MNNFIGNLTSALSTIVVLTIFLTVNSIPSQAKNLSTYDMAKLTDAAYYVIKKKYRKKRTPSGFYLLKTYHDNSGVDASVFEHKKTRSIALVFAGTQPSDPRDLLADLGLTKSEIKGALGHVLESMVNDSKMPKLAKKAFKKTIKGVYKIKKAVSKSKAKKILDKGPKPSKKLKRQIAAALSIVDKVTKLKKRKGQRIKLSEIQVVGHSLGGYLTQIVTVKKKVKSGVAFNPPGARGYLKVGKKFKNLTIHSRKSDIVGRFGRHVGKMFIYRDVKFNWKNFKKNWILENHGSKQLKNDFRKKMKPKKRIQ